MNSSRFEYCIAGPCSLPRFAPGTDIDIVVPDNDVPAVAKLLADSLWAMGAPVIQLFPHLDGIRVDTLIAYDAQAPERLMLDVTGSLSNGPRVLASATTMQEGRRFNAWSPDSPNGHFSPAAADDFIYYFLKRLRTKSLDLNQFNHLRAIWRDDPAGAENKLTQFLYKDNCKVVIQSLTDNDSQELVRRLESLSRAVGPGGKVKAPIVTRKLRALCNRVLHPIGMKLLIATSDQPESKSLARKFCQQFPQIFEEIFLIENNTAVRYRKPSHMASEIALDLSHNYEVSGEQTLSPAIKSLWLRTLLRRNTLIVNALRDANIVASLGSHPGDCAADLAANLRKLLPPADAVLLCLDREIPIAGTDQNTSITASCSGISGQSRVGQTGAFAVTDYRLSSLLSAGLELIIQTMNRRARETYRRMWG